MNLQELKRQMKWYFKGQTMLKIEDINEYCNQYGLNFNEEMVYARELARLEKMMDEYVEMPEEKLNFYKENMDQDYVYRIDEEKEFEQQEMLDITKAVFANIFRDYWATPYQRERILAKEKYDLEKIEEEKREKYNPDDIFKNRNKGEKYIEQNSNLPIEIKKEKFFAKLINFIKNIFKI